MGSESAFIGCKTCGKQISKTAAACPHCGAKQKKIRPIHWVGIVLGALIVIGILCPNNKGQQSSSSSTSEAPATAKVTPQEAAQPPDEALFIKTVESFTDGFQSAKNELQQSALRDQRKGALPNALKTRKAQGWIGTISQLETNSEGHAILAVRVSPNIEVKTWNNALSDMQDKTLINKGTALYGSLLNMSVGQKVEFSGSFFPSPEDFIKETSMTISGSMRSPEFLFNFLSVTPTE